MMTISTQTLPGLPAVTVSGRLSRKSTHSFLLNIPDDLKQRLDHLIKAGAQGTALLGLIQYALDDIERNELALHVTVE